MNTTGLPATITALADDWYECECENNPAGGLGFASIADENNIVTTVVCLECGLVMNPATANLTTQTVSVVGRVPSDELAEIEAAQ